MANLTRAQIIKTLKCCISSKTTDECSKNDCPCYDKWCGCILEEDELLKLALKELESEDKRTSKAIIDNTYNHNMPPCNVGDTIYFVNSITFSHYTVTEIRYYESINLWYFNCKNENYDKAHRTFGFFESSINETIFLNKSDANAAYEREKI